MTRLRQALATTRGRAVAAAVALGLLLVALAWATTPRSSGVDGQWEAPAFKGSVLGGRALVADDTNKALDLVTGKTITIGSVTGGERFVAGDRLLIVGPDSVDGAALDAQQRWTWTAPEGTTDLSLIAATRSGLIARHCTTADQCSLTGIGPSGTKAWSMAMPPSVTGAPADAPGGSLPDYAVLPSGERTWLLVDPATSRAVLRVADAVDIAPDGLVTLQEEISADRCLLTTGASIDRLAATTGACSWPPTHERGLLVDTQVTTSASSLGVGPLPTVHRLEGSGAATFAVEGRGPLSILRADEDHLTVRDGDRVVRYRLAKT